MDKNAEELLQKILETISDTNYIRLSDIPSIDLYMDQVTTFMDEHLAGCKRHEDDKILTKTMINNYAKNDVLPSPEKKKYSKEHMVTLILIYYFKSFLSINDIQQVLSPVLENFFGNSEGHDMTDIYQQLLTLCRAEFKTMVQDIENKFQAAQATFKNEPEELQDNLRLFAFICLLSFDVYEKKQLIESLIDSHFQPSKK